VIVNKKTEEILATHFCEGSKHDIQLFKDSRSALARHICKLADAGYQGLAQMHENSRTPAKKTKLHPLTKEQKANNRDLSHQRIRVENVICRLKVFRILSERYRNRRKRFAIRFNLIAAICNLELVKA
jgi:IS5 family transposase